MGNKSSKVTSQDRAILDLKIQRDRLIQYQKKIKSISEKETQIAKEALSNGNKRGALLALRKKKYQQQLFEKTDAQLLNLEELTQSIEFALVEKDVFGGLEAGNNILKEIQKEISIDKVEKLIEDTADAIAYQNEIEELLSGKMTIEDEDEILRELNDIQNEQFEMQLPSVPINPLDIERIEELHEDQPVKSKIPQKEAKKLEAALEAA